jgi:hypothetical protein
MRASEYIDEVTNGKARRITQQGTQSADSLALATCAIAEIIFDEERSNGAREDGLQISSESNDGYSVSYNTAASLDSRSSEMRRVLQQRKWSVAVRYLGRTGLLYRGVL